MPFTIFIRDKWSVAEAEDLRYNQMLVSILEGIMNVRLILSGLFLHIGK